MLGIFWGDTLGSFTTYCKEFASFTEKNFFSGTVPNSLFFFLSLDIGPAHILSMGWDPCVVFTKTQISFSDVQTGLRINL